MSKAALFVALTMGLGGCVTAYEPPTYANFQPYQPSIITPTLGSVEAPIASYAGSQSSAPIGPGSAQSAPQVQPVPPVPVGAGPTSPAPCVGVCYGVISPITGQPRNTYVRGYTRRDGTYVRPHTRSRRN